MNDDVETWPCLTCNGNGKASTFDRWGEHLIDCPGDCQGTGSVYEDPGPAETVLVEQGRQLASRRDDLIAAGANPADLEIPISPKPSRSSSAGE